MLQFVCCCLAVSIWCWLTGSGAQSAHLPDDIAVGSSSSCIHSAVICLQSQFGVGLREAAHNLRICPTTLKRACRRHGIHRWPRRQGSAGDPSRAESMNLDADSVTSVGGNGDADQPGAAALVPSTGKAQAIRLALSGDHFRA